MQAWDDCQKLDKFEKISYGTCILSSTRAVVPCDSFIQGPILMDERDGKFYEIRKFADNKCWMAQNLAYGGSNDICANKTSFIGNLAIDRFGSHTYGDCLDPATVNNTICAQNNSCGYLYDWAGAMQSASAIYEASIIYSDGSPNPDNYHQGICPDGWHIPSGGTTMNQSEYITLDMAIGGNGSDNQQLTDSFWQPGHSFNSHYAGYADEHGKFISQNAYGYLWSATQYSPRSAYRLFFSAHNIFPQNFISKQYSYTVRCIKN
jgi:uncharacterized protein (TIGR02145 family)